MSWEIYVSTFRSGEPYDFDTADLRAVFERGTLPHPAWPPLDTDFLYDDGHIRMDVADLGSRIHGFVVHRIFGQTAVARLLEAAARFNGLIYWPCGEPDAWSAVASSETLAHLPQSAAELHPMVTEGPAAFIKRVGFFSDMTKQDWLEAQAQHEKWHEQHSRGSVRTSHDDAAD